MKLDLDVDFPDKVSGVLRKDKSAGRPWNAIAKILEQAADKIDKALK